MTFTKKEELQLNIWERRILRMIFGSVKDDEIWRIKTDNELADFYQDMHLVTIIKSWWLRWLVHISRMPDNRDSKKALEEKPGGRSKRGRLG